MVVRIVGSHRLRLGGGEVLDALLRLEVVLHPDPLPRGVDPHERIASAPRPGSARCSPVDHPVGESIRENPEKPGESWGRTDARCVLPVPGWHCSCEPHAIAQQPPNTAGMEGI